MMYLEYKTFGPYLSFMDYTCFHFVVMFFPLGCEGHIALKLILSSMKVKMGEIAMDRGVHYFELKQLLLLSYCQAITFYLLLKSEGQPVHDHPVIARLEEIKELLDQVLLFSN